MEWQDISTAPRDGTELLGYRPDAGVFIMRFDAAVSFLTEAEIEEIGGDDEWEHEQDWFCADFVAGSRLDDDLAPTHWMFLPADPTPPETGHE